MSGNDYKVRGRSFRTARDYQAALRDQHKIITLDNKYKSLDEAKREELLKILKQGKIKFETLLGDDYLDELEKRQKKAAPSLPKSQIKKSRLSGKSSSKKTEKNAPRRLEDYDADMQLIIRQEMAHQEKKRRRIITICSLVAVICIGYVGLYYYLYEKNEAQYDRLASLIEETPQDAEEEFHINYTTDEERGELEVLDKYKRLYAQNKSLIGWIKIDDTNIDYPVMQTVNNEYYLDHNYTQEYDKNGSIFLDKDCDITNPGTNMIIYGHHMKSGRMFGDLDLYSSEEYYKEHPIIQFDTIYEEGRYQVMYVFRSRVYNEDDIVFKYYQFFEVSTPEEFDSNMQAMANMSLYDTGVTATYGDRLITLSTCDNSEEDGRFVVVAKKIS